MHQSAAYSLPFGSRTQVLMGRHIRLRCFEPTFNGTDSAPHLESHILRRLGHAFWRFLACRSRLPGLNRCLMVC